MTDFQMLIGGRLLSSTERFDVVNPATEEVYASAPDCSRAELDEAMTAASEAFAGWRADEALRRRTLNRCAELLEAHRDRLGAILCAEQGKPVADATGEIDMAALWLRHAATTEFPAYPVDGAYGDRVSVSYQPLGVVAAITPWNYPMALAVWKIAPALLAGNTMVLKPSPYTPLTTLDMGRILNEAIPAGVLNIVSGGDDLGRWMTAHPVPRKVSFTGSTNAGKAIAAECAKDLKRVTLELGGNDAAIVLPGSDIAAMAPNLFWGAFVNAGQVCVAIKRLFVPRPLYGQTLEALARIADSVRVGPGTEPGVEMGPLNNAAQFARVETLVEGARAAGARIVTGGNRIGNRGYFYQPTIVATDDCDLPLVAEEQFGPVLPVIPFDDINDAVERANATMTGLGGSVWGSDPARLAEIASRIEAGTVWTNQHGVLPPDLPFGGLKWSGVGTENGIPGLLGFTEIKVLHRAP